MVERIGGSENTNIMRKAKPKCALSSLLFPYVMHALHGLITSIARNKLTPNWASKINLISVKEILTFHRFHIHPEENILLLSYFDPECPHCHHHSFTHDFPTRYVSLRPNGFNEIPCWAFSFHTPNAIDSLVGRASNSERETWDKSYVGSYLRH